MAQLYRIMPTVIAIVSFVLFEIVYQRPGSIVWVGLILPVIFFISVSLVGGEKVRRIKYRIRLLATPLLLVWSALAFSLLIERGYIRHGLAIAVSVFLILFFESLIAYIWRRAAYKGYSLENFSSYSLTFTIFLASSVLIGFNVLIDMNTGVSSLMFLIITTIVSYDAFFSSSLKLDQSIFFLGAINIILLEFFIVFLLMPFHYMVSGAALTVLWYVSIGVSRAHLNGILGKKLLYRHIILGSVLLIILFSIARWT